MQKCPSAEVRARGGGSEEEVKDTKQTSKLLITFKFLSKHKHYRKSKQRKKYNKRKMTMTEEELCAHNGK